MNTTQNNEPMKTKAWHAGSVEFSEGRFGEFDGVFFAASYDEAAIHGAPAQFELNLRNCLQVESGNTIGTVDREQVLIQQAIDGGYDSIQLLDTANDELFYIVLNLDCIQAA